MVLLSGMLMLSGAAAGEVMTVRGVEMVFRAPETWTPESHIMVLFGGRNWPGERTLETYAFDALADKHSLFLLSPSFRDREYWQPKAWSGRVLREAVASLEKRHGLKPQKLFFYGFSAGGQCANLFYAAMPERVAAWGAHGCGVYFDFKEGATNSVPALVTCGEGDEDRMRISRQFAYGYRESGGALLWKPLPGGHVLGGDALALAHAWFDALLSGEDMRHVGEDDTLRTVPVAEADAIDLEFRNPLYTDKLKELWQP